MVPGIEPRLISCKASPPSLSIAPHTCFLLLLGMCDFCDTYTQLTMVQLEIVLMEIISSSWQCREQRQKNVHLHMGNRDF